MEIYQIIDDPIWQDKLFKLVNVFDEKQTLKRKTRQYGYEYDYKARESHKDKKLEKSLHPTPRQLSCISDLLYTNGLI